jgi:hypothetical protein
MPQSAQWLRQTISGTSVPSGFRCNLLPMAT